MSKLSELKDWIQYYPIHCPNKDCKGMLLQHPMRHEYKCSKCNKFFMTVCEYVEVQE